MNGVGSLASNSKAAEFARRMWKGESEGPTIPQKWGKEDTDMPSEEASRAVITDIVAAAEVSGNRVQPFYEALKARGWFEGDSPEDTVEWLIDELSEFFGTGWGGIEVGDISGEKLD